MWLFNKRHISNKGSGANKKQHEPQLRFTGKKIAMKTIRKLRKKKRQLPRPQPPKQVVLLGTPDMAARKRQQCLHPASREARQWSTSCRPVPATTCWGRLQWRPPCGHVLATTCRGRLQWRPPCGHVLATTCRGRLQWRPPCGHVLATTCRGRLQWRPPCGHVLATTCWGRLQWRPPCGHVLATTCWGRLQWRPPCGHVLATTCWGRLQWRPPCGHVLATTCWGRLQWRPPCRHVLATICWGRLQRRPPWRHVLATICWRRLNDQWRPPSRQSSAALNRNCRGQLNSPRRQDRPCAQKNEVEEEEKRDNWNIKDATALPTFNNTHSSPASTHNGGCSFLNKTTQLRERSAHL